MLKTLLRNLLSLVIHNALPSSSKGVVEQQVNPEAWTYITAPFDGVACLIGEDSNGFRGFRIISEKVEVNVPCVATNAYGWGSAWVPIKKGASIGFYTNATEPLTVRFVPNIQSSL